MSSGKIFCENFYSLKSYNDKTNKNNGIRIFNYAYKSNLPAAMDDKVKKDYGNKTTTKVEPLSSKRTIDPELRV
jgi:hypothetical protein